jgi:hypothetical protein
MQIVRSASIGATAAFLLAVLASPSAAQYGARAGAPIVHIYSQNGPGVESNYVTPAIQVSEDAYVFAVSMDLDGQIQVLHPDYPGISVRIRRQQQLRLPNFFAGFRQPDGGMLDATGQYANSPGYGRYEDDTRGTVIALASRAPFDLERVESGGDWDILAIRGLIERRSPASAAQALASYLGAKGEPIGRDYLRFAGAHQNYYASDGLYSCDLYYRGNRSAIAFRRRDMLDRVGRMKQAGSSVSVVGYDVCGMPIVAFGPSRSAVLRSPTVERRDADDVTAKERRFRHSPRRDGDAIESAALGSFPITTIEEPRLSGEATLNERNERGREQRQVPIDRRIDPRGDGLPGTTGIPLERPAPRRPETTVIGVFPPREYSRPVTRAAAPPPSRRH